jgi:hypothetical protein
MKKFMQRAGVVLGVVGAALIIALAVQPQKAQAQFGTPRYGAFETNLTVVPILLGDSTDSTSVVYLPNAQALALEVIVQAPASGNIGYTLGGVFTALSATTQVSYTSNSVFTIPLSGVGGYNGAIGLRFTSSSLNPASSNAFLKVIGHY